MEATIVVYIVTTLISICISLLVLQIFLTVSNMKKLPGPPTHSLFFGNTPSLLLTPEQLFQHLRKLGLEYYPLYSQWTPTIGSINIVNPEDMALILGDTKNLKKGLNYKALTKWLQSGLLLSDGEKWTQRRKMLTPAFHFKILQDFVSIFNRRTEDLVEILKGKTHEPYTEINDLIMNCTLEIILEATMGKCIELNSRKGQKYKHAIHDLGRLIVYRVLRPYLLFQWIFMWTPKFFEELKLVKILHAFTKKIIADEEKEFHSVKTSEKPLVLVDLLFALKNQGVIDNTGIQEEVDTLIFEGHDTTSAVVCFGLMAIANQSMIQENIVQEMHQVLGDIDRTPNYNDLQEMKYLERCIKEMLRLYPPVPLVSRELSEDHVTHDGYKIRKTTTVLMHIYDLHHSPHIYPDPEKFDPDRFLLENCKDRHPYAYLPFSAGPRNCIGQRFAMLEMKAIFCGILRNFILKPVDTPETIVFVTDIILRSKDNIKVKFVPRFK